MDIITNQEFSAALHQIVTQNLAYLNGGEETGIPVNLLVYSRHSMQEDLKPTMLVLPGFPPPVGSPISRYDIMRAFGRKYFLEVVKNQPIGKKDLPLAVFMVNEAWVKMMGKEQAKTFAGGSLEQFADKQEALVIVGMTLDKRTNMATLPITRTKNDTIIVREPTFMEATDKNSKIEGNLLMAFFEGFVNELRRK